MVKFKYAENIYSIVDFIYYPAKVCGIAPYTKQIEGNKVRYCVQKPITWQHFFVNGGVALFIFLSASVRVGNEVFNKEVEIVDFVVGGCYIIFQVFSIQTILHFLLKQKHFIETLKLIDSIDKLFIRVDMPLSFKHLHIVAIIMMFGVIPFYLFCVLTPLWDLAHVILNEYFCSFNCINYLSQLFNLLPAFVVRHIPLYFFTGTMYITAHSFKNLRTYIRKVERDYGNDPRTVKNALAFYQQLHNLTFHLIREINHSFMLPILFNISITFLELIAIIVSFKYSHNLSMYQATFGLTIYGSELIILLITCQSLQFELNQINRTESELTLPYFNLELANERKSLLLQLMHEKIILTANGFYNLDMAVLTAHIGLILTILMFFLKLRQDLA